MKGPQKSDQNLEETSEREKGKTNESKILEISRGVPAGASVLRLTGHVHGQQQGESGAGADNVRHF